MYIVIIIILSILLGIFIFLTYIYSLGFKNLCLLITGREIDVKKHIKQKFEDITLVVKYIPTKYEEMSQIVDMSQYKEKRIVGLTIFAQEQDIFQIAQEILRTSEESEEILEILKEGFIVPHVTLYELKNGLWLWD